MYFRKAGDWFHEHYESVSLDDGSVDGPLYKSEAKIIQDTWADVVMWWCHPIPAHTASLINHDVSSCFYGLK